MELVLQALESGKPKKGARVLIHAASGGVGIALVQLAKVLYSAHVVGTTGPKNLDFVKVGLLNLPAIRHDSSVNRGR